MQPEAVNIFQQLGTYRGKGYTGVGPVKRALVCDSSSSIATTNTTITTAYLLSHPHRMLALGK